MIIRAYAYFKDIIGTGEMTLNEPAACLGDVLRTFSRRYGKPFDKWMFNPDGSLSELVIVLVDGKDVRDTQGINTPLTPDSTIVMFPPLAGG